MFNPLLGDLTQLKDQELEIKINDLNKKYWIAARAGQGVAANQMIVILDAMKYEQERRRQDLIRNTNAAGKDSGLDDLIKVS